MATLYPSLEDMKGHQILQVSTAALWGVEQTPMGPCGVPSSEGAQGWGAEPRASSVSWQAQAAAGVRTPATTVLTEKPKLVSDTGNAGCDRLSPSRGCLGRGEVMLTVQGSSAETCHSSVHG